MSPSSSKKVILQCNNIIISHIFGLQLCKKSYKLTDMMLDIRRSRPLQQIFLNLLYLRF